MPPARLVLDTSVVMPALRFPRAGVVGLREDWEAGRIIPLASPVTIDELSRVLADPRFQLDADLQRGLRADYLRHCEIIAVPEDTPVPECRDPSDRSFLQLAVAGRADALVTEDRDLLVLAPVFDIPILRTREAQERFPGPSS